MLLVGVQVLEGGEFVSLAWPSTCPGPPIPLCGKEEKDAEPAPARRRQRGPTSPRVEKSTEESTISFSPRRRRTIAATQHRLVLWHAGQDTCHQSMAGKLHGQVAQGHDASGVPTHVNAAFV